MPEHHWKLLGSRYVSAHRIFRVREDRYRIAPAGDEREFVVLEGPDWINIIPVTDDGEVVLVRQYRHGVQQVTLEIPGGMAEWGEDPQDAAIRELREETGYAPTRVTPLGWAFPNPAIQSNRCHFYVAEGVHRVGEPEFDPCERIEIVTRPLREIPALIRTGQIAHSLVVLAFGLAGVIDGPLAGRT